MTGNLPDDRRSKGRPMARLKDGVESDARELGYRNWQNKVQDRTIGTKLLNKAKAWLIVLVGKRIIVFGGNKIHVFG